MRPRSGTLLRLATGLALLGCAGFEAPLGGPDQSRVEPGLLGRWVEVAAAEGQPPTRLLVLAFDDRQYYVEVEATSLPEPDRTSRWRAYVVPVAGIPIVNARVIGAGDEPEPDPFWTFWRYEVTADSTVVLRMISDEVTGRFTDPDSLRAYIASNLDAEELYADAVLHLARPRPNREE